MSTQSLPASASRGFGRPLWAVLALIAGGLVLYSALTAQGGVPDPTAPNHLSHGAVVLNSGLLVFREGLEAILVVAAITASFLGANAARRRPVGIGVGMGLAASVVTWFCAVWIIGALGGPGLDVQAATGLLAQELQLAGWIPTTQLGFTLPWWLGTWLAIFPTVETLAAQVSAAAAVIGSYLVAEHVRVRRPAKRGLAPGQRPELPPRDVPVT